MTLIGLAHESLKLEIVEINDLPMYNQDLEETPPAEWTTFRNKIKEYDGLLFVTPEYNRSIPAVLKNAIDIGSRPYGKSVWNSKPGAVVSVSPGNLGGFGANHHLRQTLTFVNVPTMQQPEAYIGGAAKLFDAQNKLANDSTREFFIKYLDEYEKWIAKNTG